MKASVVALAAVGAALAFGALAHSAAAPAPSFGSTKSYAAEKGPHSVSVVDLNGDAKPDLVTGNSIANTVSVLLNRGSGRFAAKHDYGVARLPGSIRVVDLNGDGPLDLVAGTADNVSVLLNRGDATFRGHVNYSGNLIAAEDLNGERT
jgi:hypothetical protein